VLIVFAGIIVLALLAEDAAAPISGHFLFLFAAARLLIFFPLLRSVRSTARL
jgi:hypothetical protein